MKPLDISRALVGNESVDHSDVVGASPVGTVPNYIFIRDPQTVFFLYSVCVILDVWRYVRKIEDSNNGWFSRVRT